MRDEIRESPAAHTLAYDSERPTYILFKPSFRLHFTVYTALLLIFLYRTLCPLD